MHKSFPSTGCCADCSTVLLGGGSVLKNQLLTTRSHLINASAGSQRKRVGPCQGSWPRDTPSGSPHDGSYGARQTNARSSSVVGSGASRAHPAKAGDGAREY